MHSKKNKGFSSWKRLQPDADEKSLNRIWELSAQYKSGYDPDEESGLQRLLGRIESERGDNRVTPVRRLFSFIRIAAAVLVIAGAGYIWTLYQSSAVEYSYLTTVVNQTQQFTLEEGTTVTLNESSKLGYPDRFDENSREVSFKGEGFFEVTADEQRPFTVQAAKAGILVVGTAFNVRDYEDENFVEVYVEEGIVKVTLYKIGKRYTLKAGDILRFDEETASAEKSMDERGNALAWKKGKLTFQGDPLEEVIASMEKLYHLDISVQDRALLSCPITINLEVGKLDEMIRVLELSCPLTFEKTSSGDYLLSGSCCQ